MVKRYIAMIVGVFAIGLLLTSPNISPIKRQDPY